MVNVFYDIYKLMDSILSEVQDVNSDRVESTDIDEKRWIFPTIPTGTDDSYPRISVQLSNIEEEPISAGNYICDNFNSADTIKTKTEGHLYYVTVWVGLYIKKELPGKIDFPDGSVKLAKNTLLGNLLFDKLLKQINNSTSKIKDFSYYYNPYKKEIGLGYEDEANRILYEVSLRIPVLAETATVYSDEELIEIITASYNVDIKND